MARSRLRIYYGPEHDGQSEHDMPRSEIGHMPPSSQKVTVSLGEIFPLLADAVRSERTWLRDFADDEVTISHDLYELVLAYQHYHRPTA